MVEHGGESAAGQAVAPDVLEAAARAYLRAIAALQRRAEDPQQQDHISARLEPAP